MLFSSFFIVPLPALTKEAIEVEGGISYDSLNNGYSSWKSAYLEGVAKKENGDVYYGTARRTEPFSLLDTELAFGTYLGLEGKKTLNLEVSASPSHNVLPSFSLSGYLHRALEKGWGIQGGGRYRRYTDSATYGAALMIEKYFSSLRSHITLYPTHASGAGSSSTVALGTDYYYGEKNRFGLIYADGKEVESLGNAGVLTTKVQSITLLGRHWLSEKAAISYETFSHKQGKNYTRYGVRIGLRRSF
jgi:YaiO family outer membrane protein